MATQATTFHAEPASPAHLSLTVEEAVAEYQKRGFQIISSSPNLRAEGTFYVMWSPASYTTVEIYEDGM